MIEIVLLVVGAIVGYLVHEMASTARSRWTRSRSRRRWKRLNEAWTANANLSPGLHVVQSGWVDGTFSEDDVQMTFQGAFSLGDELQAFLHPRQLPLLKAANYRNLTQLGVSAIDSIRLTDEAAQEATGSGHLLDIRLHSFRYFDFLMTNRLLTHGNDEEREFLGTYVNDPHELEPTDAFPNPLSVGLSVFCEDGDVLVLGKRGKRPAAAGVLWPGTTYNAVGEMVNDNDVQGTVDGRVRVSPWNTATRALSQELGWRAADCRAARLALHSVVWDRRLLDYKFFGVAVSPMSRSQIEERWWRAPDRPESQELRFIEVRPKQNLLDVIADVREDLKRPKKQWASEASLCTLRSLVHLELINPEDFGAGT